MNYSKSHLIRGALIGALLALAIAIVIFFNPFKLNSGNSGLYTLVGILFMLIFMPFYILNSLITGSSAIAEKFYAMPWHLGLRQLMQEDTSLGIGFIINSSLLGALVAHIIWKRKQKNERLQRNKSTN